MESNLPVPVLSQDFQDFIRLLSEKSVEYLLIGGYAVNLHGNIRTTKDIVFWFNPKPQNCERLEQVLFEFSGISVPEGSLSQPNSMLQLGLPPNRINLLNEPDPDLPFSPCYERRLDVLLEGLTVPVVSKADLILLKRHAGRPRDLLDIQQLGEI